MKEIDYDKMESMGYILAWRPYKEFLEYHDYKLYY